MADFKGTVIIRLSVGQHSLTDELQGTDLLNISFQREGTVDVSVQCGFKEFTQVYLRKEEERKKEI